MSDDLILTRIDEWRSNIFPANGERPADYPFPDSVLGAPELAFDGIDDSEDADVLKPESGQFIVCFIDAEILDTYTDGHGNTINIYETAPKHGIAEIVYKAETTGQIKTATGKAIEAGSTIVYVRRPTNATSEDICVLDTQVMGNDYGLGRASGLVDFFYYTTDVIGAGDRFGAVVGEWYATPDSKGPLRYSFDVDTYVASGHFNYMERQFEYPVPDVDSILVYNDSGEEAPVGGFAQKSDYGTTDDGYRYYEIIKPDEANSKAACILLGTPSADGRSFGAIAAGAWGLAKTCGTVEALCTSGCGAEDRVGTVSGSWTGDVVDTGPFLKVMDTEGGLSAGFFNYQIAQSTALAVREGVVVGVWPGSNDEAFHFYNKDTSGKTIRMYAFQHDGTANGYHDVAVAAGGGNTSVFSVEISSYPLTGGTDQPGANEPLVVVDVTTSRGLNTAYAVLGRLAVYPFDGGNLLPVMVHPVDYYGESTDTGSVVLESKFMYRLDGADGYNSGIFVFNMAYDYSGIGAPTGQTNTKSTLEFDIVVREDDGDVFEGTFVMGGSGHTPGTDHIYDIDPCTDAISAAMLLTSNFLVQTAGTDGTLGNSPAIIELSYSGAQGELEAFAGHSGTYSWADRFIVKP